MRIVLITSSVEFGGAEQYLLELAGELSGRGHTLALAAPPSVGLIFKKTFKQLDVTQLTGPLDWAWGPEDSVGGDIYDAKVGQQRGALLDMLSDAAADFAFVNANWPTHYAGVLEALCQAGLPFGVHFHLCPHTVPLNPAARRIHAETLPRAAFLSTVSLATRFFAEQTFGRLLPFEVVPNGSRFVRDPAGNEALATHPRKPILLSMGRLDHQKGFIDLVPAFNIQGALARYRLLILGQGPHAPILHDLIAPHDCQVEFLGQVSNVEEHLRLADGLVLASHFEGMSLAVLEAMSLGCIPIISDASSAREIVTEGENGFLFRVGDWRSFLLALERFDRADKAAVRHECLRRSQLFSRARMLGAMADKIAATRPGLNALSTNDRSVRSHSRSRSRQRLTS
jgi:glycosyltransferase involved in cell wall biosynthesis